MNIFVLDRDIKKCVQYHTNTHTSKMILESAQMLCTVLHNNGIHAPYKKTHANHPCTIWANSSIENWLWLKEFALALNDEYKFRYDKTTDHKSAEIIKKLPTPPLPSKGLTEFAKAMPEEFKQISDPIEAYRKYYIKEKRHIAQWTKRDIPEWWK